MKINGRAATSGTIVIGEGQRAEIELPWGSYELIFNPNVQPQNVSLSTSPPQIVFDATDNSLGMVTTFEIPLRNGQRVTLNIAVYTVGSDATLSRLVHYSFA